VFSWFREVAVLFTLPDAVILASIPGSKAPRQLHFGEIVRPGCKNIDPTVWNRGVCFVPGKYSLLCE
jgi:hypothetical protein